jgi:hypothetical protein
VALAAAAASAARGGASEPTSKPTNEEMARVWRAREGGPLGAVRHERVWPGEAQAVRLVWAAAPAAPASGREPAEVWAEAFGAWLAGPGSLATAAQAPSRAADPRRRHAWQAIDATLGQLRAS